MPTEALRGAFEILSWYLTLSYIDTSSCLRLALALLGLDCWKLEFFANTSFLLLPRAELYLWSPRQDSNPWLDVVMDFQYHVIGVGEHATW